MLEEFPLAQVTSVVSVILIVTFFVTSSDSGSLVVDMIASGGAVDPPVWQRIFWAVTQGVIAAVLLVAGGLGALQTAALTSGLPLAAVMLAICAGLYTALAREHAHRERYHGPPLPVARASQDWRRRLAHLVRHHDRTTALRYLQETARPAFESVLMELRGHDQRARLIEEDDGVLLQVLAADEETVVFEYGVRLHSYRTMTFALGQTPGRVPLHWYAEAWCSTTGERYDVLGLERYALIDELLSHYSRWVNALNEPWDEEEVAAETSKG
jgi:choline/glycine/proline betaine transport protein